MGYYISTTSPKIKHILYICHTEITFPLKDLRHQNLVSSHRNVIFSSPYLWSKLTRTVNEILLSSPQIPPFRHHLLYVLGQSVSWLVFRFMTRDRLGLVGLTVAFSVSSLFYCYWNFFRVLSKWRWDIEWVDEIFTYGASRWCL